MKKNNMEPFIITKAKAPCLECNKRNITCHSNCEDYKRFREEADELLRRKAGMYL